MAETAIQNRIRLAISRELPNTRLFRNQVGRYKLPDGRWITSGLIPGSSDLIGWRTIEITPDMVGQKIAQFVSLEIKTPQGKLRHAQRNWTDSVNRAGGISGIASSANEAIEYLR